MKKVVLALPNFRWRDSMGNLLWGYTPYGLCMLAAMIEGKYNVVIIDAYKENLTEDEFSVRIANEKPDVVGLTVLIDYFGQTLHRAAALVKEVDSATTVVAGGVYATTNIERVMCDSNIDYLIAGEGEITFPLLLDKLQSGEEIQEKGIYYRRDGVLIGQGRSALINNLDKLPFPAYHLLPYDTYIFDTSKNRVNLPEAMPYSEIFTSRGCPYHCCFCQVKYILGQNFRARSAENVLEEVDWLINNYGVKSIVVMDDNFLVDRKRAIAIMNGFTERKLEWKMANTAVFLVDDELLEYIAASGCRNLSFAIESGTYRILHEVIHKPIKSLEEVIKRVRKAQSLGIYVEANFIIGFPSETWNEIQSTLQFAEKLNADYIRIFTAIPLPHTELYNECIEKKCLVEDYEPENIDWKQGFIATEEFTREDLLMLRTYEWDRINFSDLNKRKRIMKRMRIDEQELNHIRKNTRMDTWAVIRENISKNC